MKTGCDECCVNSELLKVIHNVDTNRLFEWEYRVNILWLEFNNEFRTEQKCLFHKETSDDKCLWIWVVSLLVNVTV